jgi:hypothetical protein
MEMLMYARKRCCLPFVAVVLAGLTACGNVEKLKELVSSQSADEKQEGEAEKAVASAEEEGLPEWEGSRLFLARLEALMEGYQPVLPAIEDQTDLLKCVTDYQFTANAKLKASRKTLADKKAKSEKAREKASKDFQDKRHLQYRIDVDWEKRVADKVVYGCWDKEDYYWERGTRRRDCTEYYQSWRLRSASDSFGNTEYTEEGQGLYSQTETPEPPELMKRMEADELETPERFHCRVNEVKADAIYGCWDSDYHEWDADYGAWNCHKIDGHWKVRKHKGTELLCDTSGTALSIKLPGEWEDAVAVNRGDVVSAPLKDASIDPSGVLRMSKEMSWILAATAESLQLETTAECLSVEEILAAK